MPWKIHGDSRFCCVAENLVAAENAWRSPKRPNPITGDLYISQITIGDSRKSWNSTANCVVWGEQESATSSQLLRKTKFFQELSWQRSELSSTMSPQSGPEPKCGQIHAMKSVDRLKSGTRRRIRPKIRLIHRMCPWVSKSLHVEYATRTPLSTRKVSMERSGDLSRTVMGLSRVSVREILLDQGSRTICSVLKVKKIANDAIALRPCMHPISPSLKCTKSLRVCLKENAIKTWLTVSRGSANESKTCGRKSSWPLHNNNYLSHAIFTLLLVRFFLGESYMSISRK